MNYFNLVWLQFFVGITNEFFHSYCKLFLTGTTNYFLLVVLRIIFLGIVNLFFWPTIHCGLAIEGDWLECFDLLGGHFENCAGAFQKNAKAKHCQRKKRNRFSPFLTKSERESLVCAQVMRFSGLRT